MDDVVEIACDSKTAGFRLTHPDNAHWFITCNGKGSLCQPCPSGLMFNETCGSCLNEGEACPPPAAAQAAHEINCKLS